MRNTSLFFGDFIFVNKDSSHIFFFNTDHPVQIKLLFVTVGFLIEHFLQTHIYNGEGSRFSDAFLF